MSDTAVSSVTSGAPVLDISELRAAYRSGGVWLDVVRDFSLRIQAGETVGLVGESGSGKTTVALTIMRYLGANGRALEGRVLFEGRDLLQLPMSAMRSVWGAQIGMVPQNPLTSLNPSMRVKAQLAEPLEVHSSLKREQIEARVLALLQMVRVPDPARVADSYPHQISGGMQQRVLIAMALSTGPRLLVLDEPTTGLDVTTQAAVLDLFRDLIAERQTAALYVTHNLGVVARICDRVAVLYAGELVEEAPTADLFAHPLHPYSEGLLDSVPQLGQTKVNVALQAIPGQIPALGQRPSGCVFAPRCVLALDLCHAERPTLEATPDGRQVRCHRWRDMASGAITARQIPAPAPATASVATSTGKTLLAVNGLRVYFEQQRTFADAVARRPHPAVKAVDGVSLLLSAGRTLGIVGESGSGKTTLARAVVGLEARSGGDVALLGVDLPAELADRPLEMRRLLQYVFQNPDEALNPYLTVGETLRRPFMSLLDLPRAEADVEVARLLAAVRLAPEYAQRLPGQLSGGEKQRVAIARAFATHPALLIADEPVSALDVSVQASILNLLRDLQRDWNNALMVISHDLAVIGYLADEIAVMYVGSLMEVAAADQLFEPPYHPYTEALLSAIPSLDPEAPETAVRLEGDVPSQLNIPSGCPFHPRCPRYLGEICKTETPPWQTTAGGDRIFCHIPLAELEAIQRAGGRERDGDRARARAGDRDRE